MHNNNDKAGFSRSPRMKIFAVLSIMPAAAFIAAVWFGPVQVWTGLQNTFGLSPDPGPVEMEVSPDPGPVKQGDPGLNANNSNQLKIEIENGYIEITGFEMMSDSACLTIRLEQVPAFRIFPGFEYDSDSEEMIKRLDERLKQIYIVDQEGQEYRYQGGNYASEHFYSSGCATGVTWSSNLLLEIPFLREKAETLTLVVPLSEDEKLSKDIPRTFLEEIGECELTGGTVTW